MADRVVDKDSAKIETKHISQQVEEQMSLYNNRRKTFARHWYDNNFFDDGQHFRFISRTTGRIVDLSEKATMYAPKRSIPKTSRQIRGMSNLLLSPDWTPTVKPDKITIANYPNQEDWQNAWTQAKEIARRSGHWLSEEWADQDLDIKMALMVLLTMKNGISYMQIWPDAVEEAIKTQVYDAFDIYLDSNYTEIYDSPSIIKVTPKTIAEIKANENYDEAQLEKISPDNRYASDEIKEAYLASQFGQSGKGSDTAATLLLKEAFIKEYINDDNLGRIKESEDADKILENKNKGDMVIRQVFCAGKIWLRDEYVALPDYPFVDFRWEPGKIYQVAPIERFIDSNKSLDQIVSRIERFLHTMNVGVWLKRKNEDFTIGNVAGGLLAEYEGTPPQQMPLAGLPATIFHFTELLTSLIEEQGVTTSAMGKLPKGVKAWGAIESLKASEFSNLYIPLKQLKKTIQRISEKMLDIADDYFVRPKTVYRMTKGEPDYFDVIGTGGMEARKKAKIETPSEVIPLRKDYKVDIDIESGLGYTEEGKKGRMMELTTFFIQLAQAGYMNPDAVKVIVERLLEVFKFGPTQELMEALENMGPVGQAPFTPEQQQAVKVAMLEVINDLQKAQQGGINAQGTGAEAQAGGVPAQGMVQGA